MKNPTLIILSSWDVQYVQSNIANLFTSFGRASPELCNSIFRF